MWTSTPGTCAWPWQWESAFAPFSMRDICSLFFLFIFTGMFLNNLRKAKIIRAISKKTEVPETFLVCNSFYFFTQVLNKEIYIFPSVFGTLLAQYDIL